MERFKYNYQYHKSLVYKIFCADNSNGVIVNLEQALQIIRGIYEITAGIKQIIYLVGWQFDGHDSKYPAWSEVNPKLKRMCDKDARESLLWLMKETKKYNAVISLHINMHDAYMNSPLWQIYEKNDLIIKDKNGELLKSAIYGGEQSYLVDNIAEWEKGFAKERIDHLLSLLPPLAESGTIHIDVFCPEVNEYKGSTIDEAFEALKHILRYWRTKGFDVTTEWIFYEFIGMIPMVWHLNADEDARLKYPASQICGGGDLWNVLKDNSNPARNSGFVYTRPEGGCMYEEAWGRSIDYDITNLDNFASEFFLKTLPWYFLNSFTPLYQKNTIHNYEVYYSDDVITTVSKENRYFTLSQRKRIFVDGTDLFLPAPWVNDSWISYSKSGCEHGWLLPDEWKNAKEITVQVLNGQHENTQYKINVEIGSISITLKADEAALFTPVFA